MLVSHNIVECMDGAYPASLSAKVHTLLRDTLGFTGVIVTDDLAMDAVKAYAQDGSAAVLAIQAGKTLFFDREEALRLADAHGLAVVALPDDFA